MKKITQFLLMVIVCSQCAVACASGQALGQIVDIFGDQVTTIQLDASSSLKIGDRVDLTYMAGVLPMVIGVFEITAVQENMIIAKPVSLNIKPGQGMTIQVGILRNKAEQVQQKKEFDDGAQRKDTSIVYLDGASFSDSPPDSLSAQSAIYGEIVQVQGEDIQITITGEGAPRAGWMVDVFYVTKDGKDLPVGTWKVASVEGRKVVASKMKGIGNARPGLKAVLYDGRHEQPSALNVSPGPGGAGKVEDLFSGDASRHVFSDTIPKAPLHQTRGVAAPPGRGPGPLVDNGRRAVTFDEFVNKLKQDFPSASSQRALQVVKSDAASGVGPKIKWWLGVQVYTNDTTLGSQYSVPQGVRVAAVMEGSPAQKAGLKTGDIIYLVDGVETNTPQDFVREINASRGGRPVFVVDRNGKRMKITARLQKVI